MENVLTQHHDDKETDVLKNADMLEEALKAVWDKVRAAGDLIGQLREEKKSLAVRSNDLEKELLALRSELANREQELKRARAEYAQLVSSNGHNVLSDDEKENLKNKIRDLLAKINSHL
jgi:peptidoglycan hydrolase CwlO-like protein